MTKKMILEKMISDRFNNIPAKDVIVDSEFGNVTATVGGDKNVDCGFIEDYEINELTL